MIGDRHPPVFHPPSPHSGVVGKRPIAICEGAAEGGILALYPHARVLMGSILFPPATADVEVHVRRGGIRGVKGPVRSTPPPPAPQPPPPLAPTPTAHPCHGQETWTRPNHTIRLATESHGVVPPPVTQLFADASWNLRLPNRNSLDEILWKLAVTITGWP